MRWLKQLLARSRAKPRPGEFYGPEMEYSGWETPHDPDADRRADAERDRWRAMMHPGR